MLTATTHPIYIIGHGYMGHKLLQALLEQSLASAEQITTVARSLPEPHSQNPHLVWDLDSTEAVNHSIPKPNAIIFYFVPPPPKGRQDTRVQTFIAQLEQNTQAETKPAKIVLISTTGVYGNCHGQWVDETTPLNPSVDRARRRADAEQQFQHYAQNHNIPLVILRVSGIYAADKLPLKRIQAQTPVVQEEDSPYSNRIHANDLLNICLIAGLNPDIEGVYNCSDSHPTTMYDYFMRVARASYLPAPPSISREQARSELSSGMLSYMDESRRIDNHKLLKDFKLTLKYPDLEQGLKDLT